MLHFFSLWFIKLLFGFSWAVQILLLENLKSDIINLISEAVAEACKHPWWIDWKWWACRGILQVSRLMFIELCFNIMPENSVSTMGALSSANLTLVQATLVPKKTYMPFDIFSTFVAVIMILSFWSLWSLAHFCLYLQISVESVRLSVEDWERKGQFFLTSGIWMT